MKRVEVQTMSLPSTLDSANFRSRYLYFRGRKWRWGWWWEDVEPLRHMMAGLCSENLSCTGSTPWLRCMISFTCQPTLRRFSSKVLMQLSCSLHIFYALKVINDVYSRFSHLLTDFDLVWLDKQAFADAIHHKGAPLQQCIGFIDGTVRPIARPVRTSE